MGNMKGNELEKRASKANLSYRKEDKALILKVPVPILYTAQGMKVQQSTVDFTGVIKGGTFLAFDAKESESLTSFPLKNIHEHQLLYLQLVRKLGGIGFFLIWFKNESDKVYITPLSLIEKYWYGGGRKSIPFSDFKDEWKTDVNKYIDKVIEIKDELCRIPDSDTLG